MSSKYTKREFQKDLKKLAQLIEEHDKLERKSRRTRRQRGGNGESDDHQMDDHTNGEDDTGTHDDTGDAENTGQDGGRRGRGRSRAKGGYSLANAQPLAGGRRKRNSKKKRGGNVAAYDPDDDCFGTLDGGRRGRSRSRSRTGGRSRRGGSQPNDLSNGSWASVEQDGGKAPKRTFKVVSVSGKAVSFGNYTITKDSPIGPGRAATKAASSVCAHVTGKSGKHSVGNQCDGVKFMLKEKTRGSNQKEFGPYVVKVHKRSHAELKDLEKRFKSFGKGKYKPAYYTASAVLVHGK